MPNTANQKSTNTPVHGQDTGTVDPEVAMNLTTIFYETDHGLHCIN